MSDQSNEPLNDSESGLHEISNISSQGEEAAVVGQLLRHKRESENMEIKRAAESLKLDAETIEAMEAGNMSHFKRHESLFIDGYYRSYAQLLGVDVSETRFSLDYARPKDELAVGLPTVNYQARRKRDVAERLRERSDAIIYSLVFVMVAGVGLAIWLVWPPTAELQSPAPSDLLVMSAPAIDDVEDDSDVPFYLRDESTDNEPADDTVDSSDSFDAIDGETAEVSSLSSFVETEAVGAEEPQTSVETAPLEETTDEVSDRQGVAETGSLVMWYSGESWVEVYGGNDERLIYRMGAAGEVDTVIGILPLRILIGNTANTEVRFDGSIIDISPFDRNGVANFTLP